MNKPAVAQDPAPATGPVPVFWRVVRVAHELEARLEAALSTAGLSMAKAGLLRCLAEASEPMPLSEVAVHSQCVRSNITQLMDRLEADGLVKRVADPGDRRVRRAALTAAGRKAHQESLRIMESHERDVARGLSREEAAALTQALGRLVP